MFFSGSSFFTTVSQVNSFCCFFCSPIISRTARSFFLSKSSSVSIKTLPLLLLEFEPTAARESRRFSLALLLPYLLLLLMLAISAQLTSEALLVISCKLYYSVTTATLNQKLQNQRLDSTEPCHLSLHRWLVSNRDLFLIFFLNSLSSSLKSFKLLLRYLCKIVEIL